MLPIFITGNQNKANYLSRTLGIALEHHKLDLDEIQSADARVVVEHKVRQAYEILKVPVLVEDTTAGLTALDGLPGTFIKFFVEAKNGLENICRMADGLNSRSGVVSATYAYYDGTDITYFSGRLEGVIADHPRGTGGYGFDSVFEPDGYDGLTRAELSAEDDLATYKRIRNTDSLRTFLEGLSA